MATNPNASVVKLHQQVVKTVGDSPVWLEETGEFMFVDFFKAKIFKLNAATNELSYQILPGRGVVSLAYPTTAKDKFVALSWLDVLAFDWNEPEKYQVLANFDKANSARANDGRADKAGRLWFATFGVVPADEFVVDDGVGEMYKAEIKEDGCKLTTIATEKIDLSNGFEWSVDNRTMFFVDTKKRLVYAFDYDEVNGEVGNQRVAIDFAKESEAVGTDLGLPDGITIDANNNLWVAGQNASNVCCFDTTTGKLIDRITFDARVIASCVFGGPHLNQLYVTSSAGAFEDGGSIYRVDGLGVKGFPATRVDVSKLA